MHDSRHLVDPGLLPLLEQSPAVVVSAENLEQVRQSWRRPFPSGYEVPGAAVDLAMYSVEEGDSAPELAVRVYRPAQLQAPVGCIFHIHGGGYIGGDVETLEQEHCGIAHQLRCVLVSVNYRLAPETRFPGNVVDCYAALSWLFRRAEELGVDPARIGVMGESAGGGLAAALALLVRDRGRFTLAFQHLIYPMLDDRTCVSRDPHPYAGEFVWSPENNQFGWSSLLGGAPGADGVSPYAAPARAKELGGLPATFIATAALDLFLEENLEYARRLTRAGVPVELHVYPGAFHGFDRDPTARVSSQARRDSLAALKRFLGREDRGSR